MTHVAPVAGAPQTEVASSAIGALCDEKRLGVVHSVPLWLPLGGGWIYNQVTGVPYDIHTHVVCDVAINLDCFPHPSLHAAGKLPLSFLWQRALRRSGVRLHRAVLADVVKASRASVLHSHFAQSGWYNMAFARSRDIAHVVSCYGEDVTKYPLTMSRWRRRYRMLFRSCDLVLCEGPHMASTVESLGCPAHRVLTHPLGVDVSAIPYRPRDRPADRPLRVLMAATFRQKKGLPYALDALGELKRRGVPFEATLVGDTISKRDASEKRRILEKVRLHGLGDVVRLVGLIRHDQFLDEGYRHDVFLSPSVIADDGDAEGGAPVGLIEMAASGMPIISTTHCDIPFVLAEPNRSLLAAERDALGLADAMERLLGLDWTELVLANRERISRTQDAKAQALRLALLYRDL